MTWILLQKNFIENTMVKNFRKSVNICQTYKRMYSGTVFNETRCRRAPTSSRQSFGALSTRPIMRQASVHLSVFQANSYCAWTETAIL